MTWGLTREASSPCRLSSGQRQVRWPVARRVEGRVDPHCRVDAPAVLRAPTLPDCETKPRNEEDLMTSSKNVLAVFCDELTRRALSCYGNPDTNTPNIDRFAARAVRFDNACSTYPVCVPFRFTLMTGETAQSRHIPAIGYRMSPAERTIADEFKSHDYETIYIGKWHLEGGQNALPATRRTQFEPPPLSRAHLRNWDRFIYWARTNSYVNDMYYVDSDPTPVHPQTHQVDTIFGQARHALETRRCPDKPFFCMVSTNAPHPAYRPPAEYAARWKDRPVTIPENVAPAYREELGALPQHEIDRYHEHLESGELKTRMRLYYAMVEHVDREFGELMCWLEERGLTNNTAILFFADHGELLGNHGLTYCKQFPFEESIGIPLFIADPNLESEDGLAIEAPACTEDLYPTMLGLAGLEPSKRVPGVDLSSWWMPGKAKPTREAVLLGFFGEARPHASLHGYTWRGVRSSRFLYSVYGGSHEAARPWHFYDLQRDPLQLHNLIHDPRWRNEIAGHREWLKTLLREVDDHYPLADPTG
ncbi:MAG: sulfatase-like hydrolase/transferase [Chitinivibrionales bacterium]|nr:sulfatase-like hydrolase/transferase [Chitinivibrionales bacterium]